MHKLNKPFKLFPIKKPKKIKIRNKCSCQNSLNRQANIPKRSSKIINASIRHKPAPNKIRITSPNSQFRQF